MTKQELQEEYLRLLKKQKEHLEKFITSKKIDQNEKKYPVEKGKGDVV